MTFTYPLTLPSSPNFVKSVMYADTACSKSESMYTGQVQIYKYTLERFRADLTLPPMTRAQAEEWIAIFLRLKGSEGTFYFGDPDGQTARGNPVGTPLVNGGTQTGYTLVTDGWTPSTTGILKVGDYIQIGTRYHKILIDANSDGSGNATLDIWPKLRSSPTDNSAIVVTNAKGVFRMTNPKFSWDADHLHHYGLNFSIEENI